VLLNGLRKLTLLYFSLQKEQKEGNRHKRNFKRLKKQVWYYLFCHYKQPPIDIYLYIDLANGKSK
jgi:hypothetical protein